MLQLDVGCGPTPRPDHIGIDRKQGGEAYPLRYNDGTPVADGTVDTLVASHVLEHFSHREVPAVLADWARALKPGGTLKVAVPDFGWVAEHYVRGEPVNVQGYVMGGHVDADDRHGVVFDREELGHALRRAGLYDLRPWESEVQDCAALPVSLNLQGRKKGPLPKLKVAGAMSVPRLGFNDNFYCWFEALVPFGILPTKYDGAFWGQCLERVLTDVLPTGADYVLTVDYDSAFTREDVEHLLRLAAEHPEADAIAPVQLRRAGHAPLMTVPGQEGQTTVQIERQALEAELLETATSHFGLTLLKVETLRRLPHPWFLGVPAPDGTWGEGRLDPDTHFWRHLRAHGGKCYVAPHVVIAHGEFVLKWPGRGDLSPVYQNPSDFWDHGKPDSVWR